jgi:LuxR family maltose regulon positive regulatory protein
VTVSDAPAYLREFEHITMARLLMAQHAASTRAHPIDDIVGLLDRLLEAADQGGRLGSALEILILLALAHARDNLEKAMIPFFRALSLAEPEGIVRPFLDEGGPVAGLLKAAAKKGASAAFARVLLSQINSSDAADNDSRQGGMIELLSERERDVLRMLRTDLDGPEIAHKLGVSLNTMRTHTKSIYDKLGVNNRRAAVRRADELRLSGSGSSRQ